ncbi:MAG TPA: hypothetical protein VG942_07225 [Hyphomonadaceae bacterium]|nr:hypothetical protein [Hyphomonadaceae bacterium]
MEFKPGEIVLIVLALAIPVGLFTLLLIPGAMDAVFAILQQDTIRPFFFFGGALVIFGVLAWRIYGRIRPKQRPEPKAPSDGPPHGWPKV